MSLKMMKKTLFVSAIVAVGSLAIVACGDDKDKPATDEKDSGPDDTTPDDDKDGSVVDNGPATRSRSGVLVAVTATDTSAPIKISHKIVVLDALTGTPLAPPLSAMTDPSNGKWEIKDIPTKTAIAFWVQGEGDDKTGTYDSVITNVTGKSADDELTRISNASTATVAGMLSGFTAKGDKSAMSGGVYNVKDGKRIGVIGCTKVILDGDAAKSTEADLRYVNTAGLPTTLASQDKTEKSRGAFLFANISKGKHTLELTVDDGKTTFGKTDFYIGLARDDAHSNYKGILYQIGIEIEGKNLTPDGCM
jgi:hypothetical protein